jgi:hypothetical protein
MSQRLDCTAANLAIWIAERVNQYAKVWRDDRWSIAVPTITTHHILCSQVDTIAIL